jgi:hypothetical protein
MKASQGWLWKFISVLLFENFAGHAGKFPQFFVFTACNFSFHRQIAGIGITHPD